MRTIRLGVLPGKDVEGWMRGVHKLLGTLDEFAAKPTADRRVFGPGKRRLVVKAQKRLGIAASGIIGPATQAALKPYMDERARELVRDVPPVLIAPNQGFGSLHHSLWRVYSEGRRRGFTDLGTYNPASRLPSGAPSDHAVLPAFAFDLGISPRTGWNNLKARAYVLWVAAQPEVEYAILGDRIYFGPFRWRRYTAGGHLNHAHVSGRR